jgi:hypothetical protein
MESDGLTHLARMVQRRSYILSTSSISAAYRLLAIAFFAMGATVVTAQASEGGKPVDVKATAAAKEKAKKSAASTGDLKKLIDQLSAQRDTLIADHEALVKQLKDATEEKKKEIIDKIEAQKKSFEEVTNALHKQIRDEQRKQRAGAGKR